MSTLDLKTNKIKKLPRRTSRKQLRPYFKNPLKTNQFYLPSGIKTMVEEIEYISLRNLDDLIPIPNQINQDLIAEMRRAVCQQQRKVNDYHSKQTTGRRQSISMIDQQSEQISFNQIDQIDTLLSPDIPKNNQSFFIDIDNFLRNDL